ncbi:hypothetical protein FSP39_007979 [Pinctada imbricata]|uniref:Uncharacterized protein n=1 Tax=Pinctada imbricata TaxID=66713 RepID=A0AA88Y2P7_PINIB|nr:hypothetical protein FSP39_007979 [Pinctada imbricata]
MVGKKSEYRHEYKRATLVNNIPTYYESLTYRNKRKELEYAHTPISWDFETGDVSSPDDEVENLPVGKIELSDIKEQEDSDKKKSEECVLDLKDRKADLPGDEEEEFKLKDDIMIEKSTAETRQLTKLAKEKLNKYASTENTDSPEKVKPTVEKVRSEDAEEVIIKPKCLNDKTFIKRSKPRRPDRTQTIPLRPKSAAPPKRAKSSKPRPKSAVPLAESVDRPPFYLYGSGDSERATGIKRTHNVHCSTDIYPAALKALKQHEQRVKRREEMQRKLAAQKQKKKNPFAEKLTKETSAWQSEYQQRYPIYDFSEYEKRMRALEYARSRKVKNDF